ncbi:MAG: hypothetical protein HQ559_11550 [Lentisphaerae bacterium]|nr:hypothetical protein [Lentisphaerota bacterium]
MGELPRKIVVEIENIEQTLHDLDAALSREPRETVERAAIGAFLQGLYNGIENILKQANLELGAEVPGGPTWHRDLVERSVRLGVLSRQVADDLFELLGFRHFFTHGYSFMLKDEHLLPLASKARTLWECVLHDLRGGLGGSARREEKNETPCS